MTKEHTSLKLVTVLSGAGGFIVAYYWSRINKYFALAIFNSTVFTILNHLTERIYGFSPIFYVDTKIESFLLIMDRSMAMLTGILLLFLLHTHTYHKILLLCAVLLILCDCNIVKGTTYFLIHSCWHLAIWIYLYIMSIRLQYIESL